jgi:uncharacterized protein YbjT (DUF2867 family)
VSEDTDLDLVTGAFSYTGSHIAQRLLDRGRSLRTLTFHPDRAHPLQGRIETLPYRFDDQVALARSLEGVATLYNTYWVRFDHRCTTLADAVANSRTLFRAAAQAGVARIVHVSIANPSLESSLPHYRGKALVERELAGVGLPYAIVRPTWVFGGDRDVLANNIAWILRRFPVFALPGNVMSAAARVLGLLVHDVVLTRDEICGLTSGLLASHAAPLGEIAFSAWLTANGDSIGRVYANELRRHFATPATVG